MTQELESPADRAARRRAALRRAGVAVLELAPYLLTGVGAGLVFVPAGFLVPGLLWWIADQREAGASPATPAPEREGTDR